MLIKEAAPFIQGGAGENKTKRKLAAKIRPVCQKALDKIRHILKEKC